MTHHAATSGATAYLCHIADLPEGQARGFALAGQRHKAIVLRKDGDVYAYRDACPHYTGGTPMAWKSDAYLNGAGTHLACHSHGALFDVATGACVLGPCLGQSLTRINLNITATGEVFAAI